MTCPRPFSRPARPDLPTRLLNPRGCSNLLSSGYSEFLQCLSWRLCSLCPWSQESSPLPPLSLLGLNVPSEEALSGHLSRQDPCPTSFLYVPFISLMALVTISSVVAFFLCFERLSAERVLTLPYSPESSLKAISSHSGIPAPQTHLLSGE